MEEEIETEGEEGWDKSIDMNHISVSIECYNTNYCWERL